MIKAVKDYHKGEEVKSAYQKRPSQVGKYVPLKRVCSKIPSTPPRAWIMSVR